MLAVAALVAVAIAAGLVWTAHDDGPSLASNRSRSTVVPERSTRKPTLLRPAPPIPGFLLIADRGNNRMLLVDGKKRVLWRYPGGGRLAMPFVFDDDTFFGPRHDRIISNQEDQHTIQIISFPEKHVVWRYGHVDEKGSAPGYLNTPDDAYLLPNGLISVADAYNCRVLFISLAHRIKRQYGTAGSAVTTRRDISAPSMAQRRYPTEER